VSIQGIAAIVSELAAWWAMAIRAKYPKWGFLTPFWGGFWRLPENIGQIRL
jgi:hypothetical protein